MDAYIGKVSTPLVPRFDSPSGSSEVILVAELSETSKTALGLGSEDENVPIGWFKEDDNVVHARFRIPGVKKSEVTVERNHNLLIIKANRSNTLMYSKTLPWEGDRYRLDEMSSFEVEDGIVTVMIPKTQENDVREGMMIMRAVIR